MRFQGVDRPAVVFELRKKEAQPERCSEPPPAVHLSFWRRRW